MGDLWVVDLATSGVSGVNGAAPRSALPTYTESSPLTRELFYNAMDTFQPDSGDVDDGEMQDEDLDDQDDEGHGGQQVNHDALAQVFQLMLTQVLAAVLSTSLHICVMLLRGVLTLVLLCTGYRFPPRIADGPDDERWRVSVEHGRRRRR